MRRFISSIIITLLFTSVQLIAQDQGHVPGQLLVKLTGKNPTQKLQRDLWTINNRYINLKWERQVSKVLNVWLLSFDDKSVDENELLRLVKQQPNVLEAQFNHKIKQRDTTPNDPSLGNQWQWINTGASGGVADADVDAEKAWDITTGGLTPAGDTIVVCVVDDGTALNHPDLKANLYKNWGEIPDDGIDNDGNGYVDDFDGWNINSLDDAVGGGQHGVNVAGMIGAVGNNGVGVTGINWHIKIMTVRYGGLTEDEVIQSYDYPLIMRKLYNSTQGKKGAFVVATNSSWGIDNANPVDYPLWCSFYDTLGVAGILSCGATTNNTANVDVVGDMPTACPSDYMVSVGRTGSSDQSQGGYGVTQVDLGAPGINIYTTSATSYTYTSGTSFASPLTAGIIGLMYSAPCSDFITIAKNNPGQAALLIKQYLLAGVDKIPGFETKYLSGGRANAFNALQQLLAKCGACQPPGNITITPTSDTTATVSWTKNFDSNTTRIEYRIVGAPNYTILDSIKSNSYQISGLLSCTEYEIRLATNCGDTLSEYSAVYRFKTLGCCTNPGNYTAILFNDTTVFLNWNPLFGSLGYEIKYKKAGDQNYTSLLTLADSIVITSLLNCTNYEFVLQATCPGGLISSDTISIKTSGCGACEDQKYCDSFGTEFGEEWIANFSLNTLDNTSMNDGYKFYKNLSTTLNVGASYPISVTPDYAGQSFDEYFKVYIDYNQDGDFDDESELAWDAGQTQVKLDNTITVPVDAKPGNTRLRVVMEYIGLGIPAPESCGEFVFGETEDYCIEIFKPKEICATPENLDTVSVAETSAIVTWTHPAQGANKYTLRYKVPSSGTWTYIYNIISPPVTINGLFNNTVYNWEVQSICPSDSSGYTQSAIFQTLATVSTHGQDLSNNFSVYPNPFNNQLSISWPSAKSSPEKIEITDPLGKLLNSINITAGSSSILISDISSLTPGMYLISIKTKEQIIHKKLIKK